MTFLRLTRGHLVAAVAALALIGVTAVDWYSTEQGQEQRRLERIQGGPDENSPDPVGRELSEELSIGAEGEERNVWQASGALDRIVLVLVLGAVLLALAAAALRAADRRYAPPYTPSVLAAATATLAALLVALRIFQVGAVEAGGIVKIGAPLGLLAVGVLALGAARAARAERNEAAASPS
jgi:drug/metabolite transporter (DMT)-like permease